MIFESTHVRLRPFTKGDAPVLVRWVNDPQVMQFLGGGLPTGQTQEEEWIDQQYRDPLLKGFSLAIEIPDGNTFRLIGSMGLHHINFINQTAITGALIGEKDCWGKGYGSHAKMLLLKYAFHTLNLHAICSMVIAFNERSQNYNKKCGYREMGRKPEWIYRHGRRYDEVMMVVLRNEWERLWEAYESRGCEFPSS